LSGIEKEFDREPIMTSDENEIVGNKNSNKDYQYVKIILLSK
jgi:hypothetical protein